MFIKLQQILWLIYIALHLHQPTVCGELEQLLLTKYDKCICPGDVLVFECTVAGGSATVWRGTPDFFACSTKDTLNQEIVLLHDHYDEGIVTIGTCNNGSIVGRIIRAENGNYTSQLNVTFTSDLRRVTLECLHDDGANVSVVGNSTIDITGDVPPPDKVYITEADFASKRLTFNWTQVVTDCDVTYNVTASNCGSCPNTTTNTTVTCTDVPTDGSLCMFAVQAVVCGNLSSIHSDMVTLRVTVDLDMTTTCDNNGLLSAFIILVVILVLTITVICFVLVLIRPMKNKCAANFLQNNRKSHKMPRPYEEVVMVSDTRSIGIYEEPHVPRPYEEVVKVFDTRSIGMYEEPQNVTGRSNNISRDECIDLDQLLMKLKGKLSSQWYLYGLAIGVPKEVLDKLKDCPEEECLTEVLDYWLRNHFSQPTWSEVFNAQKKLEFYNMATNLLNRQEK